MHTYSLQDSRLNVEVKETYKKRFHQGTKEKCISIQTFFGTLGVAGRYDLNYLVVSYV